jgi:hypothetical protein
MAILIVSPQKRANRGKKMIDTPISISPEDRFFTGVAGTMPHGAICLRFLRAIGGKTAAVDLCPLGTGTGDLNEYL